METVSQGYPLNFTQGVTEESWTIFETDLATSLVVTNSIPTDVVALYHRIIVVSVWTVIAILGLLGNLLVIIAVLIAKKLRTTTNILVVNLAIADFISCLGLPFQNVALLSQTRLYPLPEVVCAIVAGIIYTCVCCSVSTLVAIAFVRWYVITRSIRGHQGLNTPRNIGIVVVFIWVESVAFMVVPPVLGIGTLGFSEYYAICSVTDDNMLSGYYSLLQGGLIVIAVSSTLIFYALILIHVLWHNRKFRSKYAQDEESNTNPTSEASKRHEGSDVNDKSLARECHPPMIKAINKKEVEITKNLFMVVCIFMLCFLLSSVNFIIPGSDVFTLYGTMIIMANSAANPIIYGLKHPNFQEVFKSLLLCCSPSGRRSTDDRGHE